MKRFKKTAISTLLVFLMLFTFATPFSAETLPFPDAVWPILNAYVGALNENDSAGIVTHGRRLIEFWLDGETSEVRAEQWGQNPVRYQHRINGVYVAALNLARHYRYLGDAPQIPFGQTERLLLCWMPILTFCATLNQAATHWTDILPELCCKTQ
ncbi:MAG: hypothetical protein FWE44_07890 [Defluviitaleaceae bacterium]|nr:hypothetical protein [Defluviitaleaceae bacterium]